MNIFRCIISRFSASPRVIGDDRRTIDRLTAKYDEAVDIMNQQTAALLAACGVLETYSVVPADKFTDAHGAIAEGCLEVCRKAVARAESFPTPEIAVERLANPEPIPAERRCHPYEMGKADAGPPLAERLNKFIKEYAEQESIPPPPPNADYLTAVADGECYVEFAEEAPEDGLPPGSFDALVSLMDERAKAGDEIACVLKADAEDAAPKERIHAYVKMRKYTYQLSRDDEDARRTLRIADGYAKPEDFS